MNVGVSRYLEIDGIRYDKTENLTDFSRYDYLLTHDPMEAGEEFRVIGVEKCFSGIDWRPDARLSRNAPLLCLSHPPYSSNGD